MPWTVAKTRIRADSLGGTSTALAIGEKADLQVPADAIAALDRRAPLVELLGVLDSQASVQVSGSVVAGMPPMRLAMGDGHRPGPRAKSISSRGHSCGPMSGSF